MRSRVFRVLGVLLALGIVASCWLLLPPLLGISGAGEMEIREVASDAARGARGMLLLTKPVFAAEPGSAQEGMSFLEEEAGISAWTKIDGGIDLRSAATAFRTVERQTDEYVIGSVELPGLPETEDVHVFVHKTGWVVAYYLRKHLAAKIIDWGNPAVTKLEQALGLVTTAAGVPLPEVKYFDFRFPDAEKIMIIVDDDSFRLKIPGDFTVFERSYSFWAYSWRGGHQPHLGGWLTIDERDIVHSRNRRVRIGTLTVAQLKQGVFQTVGVRYDDPRRRESGIAIVLIYREQ